MDLLKRLFFEKAMVVKSELKEFLKEHGEKKVDEVTFSQLIGGMRGVKLMLWETSLLDSNEGIRFRGFTIPELITLLPKADSDTEPLPEGLFWLMLTGEIPTIDDVNGLSKDLSSRSTLSDEFYKVMDALPENTHPMTQFSIAILTLQNDSIFVKKYEEGCNKNDYWDATYEDALNLIAKLPGVASYIYTKSFKNKEKVLYNTNLDWSANFVKMLGFKDANMISLMRLYMTIHADHEGGNASAHATHLTGSTLSDPYLSFSSAMNTLAGPLHGLANQEVIVWIEELVQKIGTKKPSTEQIRKYVHETIEAGRVVPGYGHAVLRKPDPRFIEQKRFAEKYLPHDDYVQIVWKLFETVPEVLGSLGKVSNPWPNVDAHSGAILVHYGLTESNFYTVLFGVSRSLGVLAQLCWSRALNLPLERPKSMTLSSLKKLV